MMFTNSTILNAIYRPMPREALLAEESDNLPGNQLLIGTPTYTACN